MTPTTMNLPAANLSAGDLIDTPLMQRLSRFLDTTAYRSGIIATNIANIDTPGYHARDLDFRSQLTSLMSGDATEAAPRVTEVAGLTERPDGNNVNMDREGLALGQLQLQFQTGVALLRAEPTVSVRRYMRELSNEPVWRHGDQCLGLDRRAHPGQVVAGNMANAESTHTSEGGPYQRQEVVSERGALQLPHAVGRSRRRGLRRCWWCRSALGRLRHIGAYPAL